MFYHPVFDGSCFLTSPSPQKREIVISPEDIIHPMMILSNVLENVTQKKNVSKPESQRIPQIKRQTDEAFHRSFDVQHFTPEEINVKLVGENVIAIEGKHEEKGDEHGSISRHFVRKFTVPKGFDLTKVESRLSSDGVLTIIAPKINVNPIEYKEIPIVRTDQPVQKVENKESQNDN